MTGRPAPLFPLFADLETLHSDPSRTDIAWRLGFDADIMDESIRLCEVRNFVKHLVLPFKANKEHLPNV